MSPKLVRRFIDDPHSISWSCFHIICHFVVIRPKVNKILNTIATWEFSSNVLDSYIFSVHRELTLQEFKNIFFWEYLHRMWGRSIGLFFAIPAIYFWRKGWLSKAMKPRVGIYGSLIVFQVIYVASLHDKNF